MIIKMGYSGMTKEEKDLLLKDLSARLPYGVKVLQSGVVIEMLQSVCKVGDSEFTINPISYDMYNGFSIEEVKPYLRPMSSMTGEEFKEYHSMLIDVDNTGLMDQRLITKIVDWLDRKMFDHRNLVPKGLALEAPEDMYKTE